MPRVRRNRTPLQTAGFIAVVAVLGLLTVLWWTMPLRAVLPQTTAYTPVSPPQFALAEAGDYAALADRPLFRPTRRPRPRTPEEPVTAPRPESTPARLFTLKATMSGEGAGVAALQDTRTSRIIRVRQGAKIEGWTLEQVSPASVTFERDGRRIPLRLKKN